MDQTLVDQLSSFVQDRWFIIVGAVVVLLIVISVVKTVLKWVLVLALIAGVGYYGYDYTEGLKDLQTLGGKVATSLKNEAFKAMSGEAANATYTDNGDGTYTVQTENLELKGSLNAKEAELSYRGQSLGKVSLDDAVSEFITKAKQNAAN